jgi:hypothetical protein
MDQVFAKDLGFVSPNRWLSSPANAGDPVIADVGDYWMPRMRGA